MKFRAALGAIAFAVAIGAPGAAFAQTAGYQPGYYAQNDAHHVSGRVESFDGRFQLVVHHRQVHLHQGTIIHPTGATLAPGQWVSVRGYWARGEFQAQFIAIRSMQ